MRDGAGIRIILYTVLLLVGLSLAPASTAAEATDTDLAIFQDSVTSLRALLEENAGKPTVLESLSEDASRLILALQKCVRNQEKKVLDLEVELDSLGEAQPNEARLVRDQRSTLKNQQANAKATLGSCRILLNDTVGISAAIQKKSRAIIRKKLLVPGTDLLSVAGDNLMDPSDWWQYGLGLVEQYRGLMAIGLGKLLMLVGTMLISMLPGWLLRGWLMSWGAKRIDNDFTSILLQSLKVGLANYLPWLLATVAGSIFFLLVPEKPDEFLFWAYVTYSLTAFLSFMLIVRVLLYPLHQIPSPLLLPRPLTQAMARRLRVLGLLCFIAVIHYASLEVLYLPLEARQLARGVFLSLIVLNLIWLVWLLGQLPRMETTSRRVRALITSLLLGALLAEWLGYRGLSSYLLYGVVGSVLLGSITWILHAVLAEICHGLDRGKFLWQRRLRKAAGLDDGESFPGLTTLHFLLALGLWSGLALSLMKLWGVPDTLFQHLYIAFQSGFQVAGLHITPSRIIIALLIFALLLQVFSRTKESLEKRWLPASKLDRGAREATVTIFGYIGFLIAILIGLMAAGLELGKLALIAGALSVGIGFGLQNVVNNFVSGLILLFERPISTGDFVGVGDVEGYVRRISIRSTEIEMMDRRSVIVPNSDLISGQVINWMRNDSYGRVKVEVGVAYGSDLKLVMQLLREIVTEHADIVNNSQVQPGVYCTGFGDSSINFVIYAVVGSFTTRFQVVSEVCLAIDASFARHGIEIPFPQRVIHTVPGKKSGGVEAGDRTGHSPAPESS